MASVLPLMALRAFVEVGQRGSIKAAAEALHVTSGAVSQQIRQLEERVGITLFLRERQGLRLTPAGAEVYPTLLSAFHQIEQSMQRLDAARTRQTLTVSTLASFAASWLIPRLGRFSERYPQIEVRVEASPQRVDMRQPGVDIAIRHGLGAWPGVDAVHLMAPVLVPVACPGLMATDAPLTTPADCLAWPLLHDSERADWSLWLAAHGVSGDARSERGTAFDDDFLLIRAAEAGQGLALVPQEYAREEIAAGRLVQVLDKPWPARFAYYLVTRPADAGRHEIRVFSDWIRQEARLSSGGAL